jgi:hypothetical protein
VFVDDPFHAKAAAFMWSRLLRMFTERGIVAYNCAGGKPVPIWIRMVKCSLMEKVQEEREKTQHTPSPQKPNKAKEKAHQKWLERGDGIEFAPLAVQKSAPALRYPSTGSLIYPEPVSENSTHTQLPVNFLPDLSRYPPLVSKTSSFTFIPAASITKVAFGIESDAFRHLTSKFLVSTSSTSGPPLQSLAADRQPPFVLHPRCCLIVQSGRTELDLQCFSLRDVAALADAIQALRGKPFMSVESEQEIQRMALRLQAASPAQTAAVPPSMSAGALDAPK